MLVCSTAAVHCRRAPRCFLHDMMQRHFISKRSMHKRCNITQRPAQSDRCRRLGPPAGRRVRPAALRRRRRCADVRTVAVTAKSKRTCGIITLRRLCNDPTTAIVARAARASCDSCAPAGKAARRRRRFRRQTRSTGASYPTRTRKRSMRCRSIGLFTLPGTHRLCAGAARALSVKPSQRCVEHDWHRRRFSAVGVGMCRLHLRDGAGGGGGGGGGGADRRRAAGAHTLTGGAHGAGVRVVGTAVILNGNTAYRMRGDAQ